MAEGEKVHIFLDAEPIRVCKLWNRFGTIAFSPAAWNNYAIRYACSNGNSTLVQSILEDHRIDPAVNANYCIRMSCRYTLVHHDSCRHGYSDIVKLLVKDPRVNVRAKSDYAVNWAVAQGHYEIVKGRERMGTYHDLIHSELLRYIPVSSIQESAITTACTYGHTKVLLLICSSPTFNAALGDQHLIRWSCRCK